MKRNLSVSFLLEKKRGRWARPPPSRGAGRPLTPHTARTPRPKARRRRRRRPTTHFPARSLWEPLEFISCARSCLTAPAAILGAAASSPSHHGAARAGGRRARHVTDGGARAGRGEGGGARAERPHCGHGCGRGYPTGIAHGNSPRDLHRRRHKAGPPPPPPRVAPARVPEAAGGAGRPRKRGALRRRLPGRRGIMGCGGGMARGA